VNALQKIGGAALAAVLVLAVAAGLTSPNGTGVLASLGNFGRALGRWARDLFRQLGGTSIAGNAGLAFGLGVGLALLLVVTVPAARASRGGAVAAILLGAVVGLLLYNPSIVSNIGA
jgi:regulator of protease activity HflC (stomatin/prohibitin superfamily)